MSTRASRGSKLGAVVVLLGASVAVGTIHGDDEDPPAVLRLLHAAPSCDGCDPGALRIELVFDAVVDPAAVAFRTAAAPHVDLLPDTSAPGRRVVLRGAFRPQTDYRFTLPSGFVAVDGSALAEDRALDVRTGGGRPRVHMAAGDVVLGAGRGLPMVLTALREARVRTLRVRPDELHLARAAAGVHAPGRDPLAWLPEAMGSRARVTTVRAADADAGGQVRVDPFVGAADDAPVLVIADAPGAPARAALVQRGGHSVLLKVGAAGGLVWVTDVARGAPAAGAQVRLYQRGAERFAGRTDADGVLRLPAAERLRAPSEPGAGPSGDPIYAVAHVGREIAYASERLGTGLESWQFDLPTAHPTGARAFRGMVTAERGIYRPGETVHLLGILRRLDADGALSAPGGEIALQVSDPDGSAIVDRAVRLTAYGTFRLEVPVPRGARLGRWQVLARRGDTVLSHRFEVGAYRASTFEVDLPPSAEAETDGDRIVVPVRARYLYGSPVRDADVSFSVTTRPHRPRIAGAEGFHFGRPGEPSVETYLTSDTTRTGSDGVARLELPLAALLDERRGPQSLDVIFEAQVRDAAGDVITARTSQTLLRGPALVGIRSERWAVRAEEGWPVQLLAVGPDGRPRVGEAMVARLYRRVWRGAAEGRGGRARYRGTWQEELVEERELTSAARPVAVRFSLPGGGSYRLEVGTRGDGTSTIASTWAWGEGGSAPIENHPRMELITDREAYSPGDTARIVAQSPYSQSLALVTVEREGVLDVFTTRLSGSGTPIDVAVGEALLPNAFVGVAAIPIGLGDEGPPSGTPMRVGYTELRVSPEERRLDVALEPSSAEHRPGEAASVRVRVRDHRGRPVRAEVTLWAADEGVLALTGYRTPDPFAPAYARHDHAVASASSLVRWLPTDPDLWDDGSGGDGGVGESASVALRSRFLSTAFFARPVTTGADGTAEVGFELPDNLTRWRVMAAVADRGQRFGAAEESVSVRKPLSANPSLPRFLIEGDLVDVGVVLHNDTGAAGVAELDVEVQGGRLLGEARQRVALDAGAQRVVRVPMLAGSVGEAKVRARVRMAGESDGFEIALPVQPPTSWRSVGAGDGRVDGPTELAVRVPRQATPGHAELVLTLSPSVLASLEGGLAALREYPHGCVEQTTSRLIPMVLLEDLGGAGFATADHRARMTQAIDHVLRHQNHDGGFGLWPPSDSEGFLTAYALWGLLTARAQGYDVPSSRVDSAVRYLRGHARHGDDMHGQFSDQETAPFAAFVLSEAGTADGGLGRDLAATHASLSRFSVGLLGGALASDAPRRAPLFEALGAARRRGPRGAVLVGEDGAGGGVMHQGRDLRATAAAVQALVAAGRRDEAEDLVAGIVAERRDDGTWGHTYNNMWALVALSTFARTAPEAMATVPVTVRANGRVLARVTLSRTERAQRVVVPADALPAPGRGTTITLEAPGDAGVRYAARLRYVPDPGAERPESHGMTVSRELFDAESGEVVHAPRLGQLLRVRLTLRVDAPTPQVALVDRLPAGFEPVDTSLATEQRRFEDGRRSWHWTWRELHDDRVSYFANDLPAGTHEAEYLVRASRPGEFTRPAPTAEAMYDDDIRGSGRAEHVVVR